ncbi:MAG: ATP-binding protein, partial [Bacteroidales bacterium]|nr:ATP-binding protein [Bacteroidales bacterium]
MEEKELIKLVNQGESETLEFKTSFSKAVIETIVAFSNTRGGKVLIGINNQKEIVGVSIMEETVQKWVNEVKQNTNPVIFPSFEIIRISNKTVFAIVVNEFPLKPLSYKNIYYSRKNNSNHLLTIDEITELRFASL